MFVEYAWLIPLLPGLAFVISLFLGKHIKEGGGPVVVGAMALAFVISFGVLLETLGVIGQVTIPFQQQATWIDFGGGLAFHMGVLIDNLSAFMVTLVSFLVLLIAVYSLGYMHEEGERKPRYYAEISLFAVGMLGTVLATNFLQLLVFWEIMGLCSYLLIGFWYDKPSAASAAKRAFLVTRIGDVLFLVGIVVTFAVAGTLNFLELEEMAMGGHIAKAFLTTIPLLLFGGAVGKSAQFPLHLWLPDAMEGPTTVSALIHAATMVKAGVFLVARAWPFVVNSPTAALTIAVIGGFTAFFAATMALVNVDIKKVLAYSTISQLGYMILALGAGAALFAVTAAHGKPDSLGYTAGLFHLMNHAFFKALLFLGAGAVIHAVHTNDMTKMGGLKEKMPITAGTMLVATLAISGIPPFSGFWSKDEILAATIEAGEVSGIYTLLWVLGVVTAFMTAFYMFRLWYMTFAGEPEDEERFEHAHEAPPTMTIPLAILGVFAGISGLFTLLGDGFGSFIYFDHAHHAGAVKTVTHIFTSPYTYISLLAAVGGIALAYKVYRTGDIPRERFTRTPARRGLHRLLLDRYGYSDFADRFGSRVVYGTARAFNTFDEIVVDGFINLLGRFGLVWARLNDLFDLRVVDGAVDGLRDLGYAVHRDLRDRHTGLIPTYANAIVLGALALLLLISLILPSVGGGL